MNQKYTCEKTCRNRISGVIKQSLEYIPKASTVLDYGGGKYDKGTEFFQQNGIKSFVYDPFNRSDNHNKQIVDYYDFGVCGNVLNVVAEKEIRLLIVQNIMSRCPKAFFTIYEKLKDGIGRPSRDGWQNNQPLNFYIKEIEELYPVKVNGKLLIIDHTS